MKNDEEKMAVLAEFMNYMKKQTPQQLDDAIDWDAAAAWLKPLMPIFHPSARG